MAVDEVETPAIDQPAGPVTGSGELMQPAPGVHAPPSLPSACVAASPTPSSCCPSGFTQLLGDANINNFAVDNWNSTNHCVFSYASADTVALGKGGDLVFAGINSDTVHGGPGDDHLRGDAGADRLEGGPGGDLIYGEADNDTIYGGAGNDTIYGGTQNDTIRPGPGADAAYGEDGNDIFVIGSACEVTSGDIINGGNGTDNVRSPLTQTQLTSLGVTFTSIESFTLVTISHLDCFSASPTLGTAAGGPKVSPNGIFVGVAPRDNGSMFGSSGANAYSISSTGTITSLASGGPIDFAPAGNIFSVRDFTDQELAVYNAAGALQSTISVPNETHTKLFPASNYVYVPVVDEFSEQGVSFSDINIYNLNGTLKSTFSAPGLALSRLTSTHVIHATETDLVKTDLNGVQAWSVARTMGDFAVSDTDPTHFIAEIRGQPGKVGHFTDNGAITYTPVQGLVWDLAISPLGYYSAATVHNKGKPPRLYMFYSGVLQHAIELPLVYANSLWVSEQGEVFVGGQMAASGMLLAYNALWGTQVWQQSVAQERNGERPRVVVSPDGDDVAAMNSNGMYAYTIARSP